MTIPRLFLFPQSCCFHEDIHRLSGKFEKEKKKKKKKKRRAGESAPLTEAAREKGDSQVADESETYTKLGSSCCSSFSHRTEDALATYLHTTEKPFTASQKTDTCCGDSLTSTYDEEPKPSITFIVQMIIGLERFTVGGTDQRLWS